MELAASRRRPTRYSNQATRPNYGQATVRSADHWRNRPSLRIRIGNLPRGVTTNEIYRNFEQYGRIVYILILEARQGGNSSAAEINFEPVPAIDFWSQRRISFHRHGTDMVSTVYVELDRYQKELQMIASPVNDQIKYPEKLEVSGTRLDFGFLSGPASMTPMYSCADGRQPSKLLLNLKRKEIVVHFTFVHQGSSGSKPRSFRLMVALDEQFNIWQTSTLSFVLHLSKPPPYTKMLSESRDESHSRDGRSWSIEDMWARQADICAKTSTYRKLESMPVSLQKDLNTINIARWTTFCFHASNDPDSLSTTQQFVAALKDWNIPVQTNYSFEISPPSPDLENASWSIINGSHDNDTPFSSLQDLSRVEIDFSVRYQLEVCLSHGYISEYSVTSQFLELLAQWPPKKAKQALVYVATNAKRLYDPMILFTDIQYSKPLRARRLPDNCIEVYSATVTATGLLVHTPSVEISNRIIRKYKTKAHRFLRVRFEDDDYRGQTRLFASLNNKMVTIFKRVKRALRNGIILGDIKYEFLAWGNSQLREHGVWFVAPTSDMTADRIREEMGSFKETVVAKKAARMGQCFSTTQPVHLPKLPSVSSETVIDDIEFGRFIFSDGVGKISELAARLVSNQLNIKGSLPSLFQFRLGGCKGVLAVAKDIPGINIQIRKSQFKFDSLSGDLEIIRWAQFWQPFLNRQIILCLSHLGVPTKTFLRMQDEAVHALNKAMTDETAALTALRTNVDPNQMTLSLCELVEAGFLATKEPFIVALLHLWRAWSLKYLKEKAKIPVSQGAFVLGTVDETATLKGHTKDCPSGERTKIEEDPSYMDKLPEIFCQITDVATGKTKIIEGLCFLARNPSLYPGDIRVVVAKNISALHHMVDVVVMPQTGERDLPSMCSGGDLDGDDYIVIWDPNLIPPIWNVEPFHYDPPEPKRVANEITATHLIDFFHDYMRYDALGRIATAHLAAADYLQDGLDSDVCQELAALHSKAVDYPKTGVPAIMERRLERNIWPHFMEKASKRMYHSGKVLGQLYDSVQKVTFKPNYDIEFDDRILGSYDPPEDLIDRLRIIKADYDSSLRRILTQHGIGTEFELWSTFVLHHSKASKDYKFHEEVGSMSKVLKDQFHEVLTELADGKDFEHLAPVAVAAYKLTKIELEEAKAQRKTYEVTSEDDREAEMPFISFPWVLQDILIKIAAQAEKSMKKIVANMRVEDTNGNLGAGPDVIENAIAPAAVCQDVGVTEELTHQPKDSLAEEFTRLTFDVEESPDLYGPDGNSATTESSSNNESTLVTPVSDKGISDPYLLREPVRTDGRFTPLPEIHDDHAETPIGSDGSIKPDLLDGPTQTTQSEEKDMDGMLASTIVDRSVAQPSLPSHEVAAEQQDSDDHTSKQWTEFLDSQDASASGGPPKASKKTLACELWRRGQCRNSEKTCYLIHQETGKPGAWLQSCWFWKNGLACTRGNCSFEHWDTGKCATPPAWYTRSRTQRNPRGSPSKRRRRQPLTHMVPVTDSDSEMDPVPQARRFPRRSPTKRTAQPDSDEENDYDSGLASFEDSISPDQLIDAPAINEIPAVNQRVPRLSKPVDVLLMDQENKEHVESKTATTLPNQTDALLQDQTSSSSAETKPVPLPTLKMNTLPANPEIDPSLCQNDERSTTATNQSKPAESDRPYDPLSEKTNTNKSAKLVIPPWNPAGRSGHIVNLCHGSGHVQSSKMVLDDPAEHQDDSDYEVDEILD